MKRLLTRLREEPALIGTGLSVIMAVGAAFGLDITDAQRDALLGLATFIGMVGFGIRSKVKPVAKIEREAKEDATRQPRAARLRPHLRGDE
jgi:hypothetical protein